MDEKYIKTILIEQREEYQRYMGALVEDFTSKIQLIAETLRGMHDQLIALRNMVAQNTEDIEIIKADLHIIKDDLKEKVGRDEFKVLERRVGMLEQKS